MSFCSPEDSRENKPRGEQRNKLRKYYCDLCSANCTSAVQLAQHFLGTKHKRKLRTAEPQKQNAGTRLSGFLKAHMEKKPVVGLEYVMEVKKDSSYKYSCQLCKIVNADMPTIVAHVLDSLHTECYIKKHFTFLLPSNRDEVARGMYFQVLRDAARMIVKWQNNQETQVMPPESDDKTRGASEDIPPSKPESDGKTWEASEDIPPSKPESDGKTRGASEDIPPSKPESDGKTRGASEDIPPSKPESDGKTRGASEDIPPSKPESDGKTREAIKDAPPSKPESDSKTRKAVKDTPPSKPESDSKTRKAVKDAPPSKPESDSKTRKAVKDAPPSKYKSGNRSHSKLSPSPYQKTGLDESRESYRYSKMLQKSISDDPPLAKRSRNSTDCDRDALPSTSHMSKYWSSHYNKRRAVRMDRTATPQLEFRTNDEFLEYFANFVISDDEDVRFIRTITQNCIKALTSFQEEEAERQKTGHQPEAPLEDTSRTAQKIPGILEDETESHLSDSKTTLLKDTSNPPSDAIPKNDATDLFFNSIKDMDESEVVGVFQKLAATNPEFQGIDIPSVIRFLKDSGRLKKP